MYARVQSRSRLSSHNGKCWPSRAVCFNKAASRERTQAKIVTISCSCLSPLFLRMQLSKFRYYTKVDTSTACASWVGSAKQRGSGLLMQPVPEHIRCTSSETNFARPIGSTGNLRKGKRSYPRRKVMARIVHPSLHVTQESPEITIRRH